MPLVAILQFDDVDPPCIAPLTENCIVGVVPVVVEFIRKQYMFATVAESGPKSTMWFC